MKKIVLVFLLLIIWSVYTVSADTNTTLPEPNFIATPVSGSAPLTVQFTDTSTGNPGRWSWDFGDGQGGSAIQNPKYTFYCNVNGANSLIIPVKLYVWSNSGICKIESDWPGECENKTVNIILTSLPPNSAFTATPTSGPAPLTVQFTDTSPWTPTGWYWTFGDGTTSTIKNPSHSYTISGVYTATLTHPGNNDLCNWANPVNTTITVLSPIAPGTTTSQTLTPNQTETNAISTTSVTAQTTLPAATSTQSVISTPSRYYYTPQQTATTIKAFTSIPTVTPTQKSPLGIEFSILAISAAILIVMSQYRKP
ncbi:PKD domain-containing protein [Methanoregula sp.]|uniref:PKD domain-containing protein n=1 Tax=Methanoregula sp. TaxID=2052170 RepID=UPI003FD72797